MAKLKRFLGNWLDDYTSLYILVPCILGLVALASWFADTHKILTMWIMGIAVCVAILAGIVAGIIDLCRGIKRAWADSEMEETSDKDELLRPVE